MSACRAPTPAVSPVSIHIPKATPVPYVCPKQTEVEATREALHAVREKVAEKAHENVMAHRAAATSRAEGAEIDERAFDDEDREIDEKTARDELPRGVGATVFDEEPNQTPAISVGGSVFVDAGDGSGGGYEFLVVRAGCRWQDSGFEGGTVRVEGHHTPAGERLYETSDSSGQCGSTTHLFRLIGTKLETVASFDMPGGPDMVCPDLSKVELEGNDVLTGIKSFERRDEQSPWKLVSDLTWRNGAYEESVAVRR